MKNSSEQKIKDELSKVIPSEIEMIGIELKG